MSTKWRIAYSMLVLAFATATVGRVEADAPRLDSGRVFLVAADPNNLPFSNQREQGFENKLATLIAGDLHASLKYEWQPQRRGFLRDVLGDHRCDAIMGVPAAISQCLTTTPYYRSSYVFVGNATRGPPIDSLDDPRLREMKIGAQLMGDGQMSPPAELLVERGLGKNLVGFSVYSDDRASNPLSEIVTAVAAGRTDAAVAWGPMAGYFARNAVPRLAVQPIRQPPGGKIPLSFDISVGVRKDEPDLRHEIDHILKQRHTEIVALLDEFGVPRGDEAVKDSGETVHHE